MPPEAALKSVPPQGKNLIQKLAAVMAQVGRVEKNGRNTFHNYDYATEADIADAVRGALAAEGVMLLPTTEKVEFRDAPPGKDGKVEKIASVTVRYRLTDGTETIESVFVGEGQDRGDKAVYKAYTGAHKYFLLKTFSISTGDDADPEREENSPPRKTYGKPSPAPAPKEEDRNQATERDVATAKGKAKGLAASASIAARASKVWTDFKAKAPAGSNEQADGFRLWIKRILGTQKGSPEWTLDDVVKLEVALTANDLTPDERCDVGDGK